MLAVVKNRPGAGFALRDMPVPEPPAGWVRVAVRATGLCGSDLPIFDGQRDVPDQFIPGHETVGVIESLGAGVANARVGQRVAVNMVVACHTCLYCRGGRPSLCDSLTELGIHLNGGFAEYVIAPAENLQTVSESLSDAAATAVDPLASVYHGLQLAPLHDSDTVAVLGAGPMGLYAVQLARLSGVRRVIAIARRASALAWSRACGADLCVDATQSGWIDTVRRLTDGHGPSFCIEATGAPAMFEAGIELTAKGGRMLVLGVFHEPVSLRPGPIVRKELQLTGSLCYSADDYAQSMALLAERRITPLAHRVLHLREMQRALDLFRDREVAKAIVAPV